MHVAPADLRSLRQDGILVRFAMLGPMAFVFAEIPSSGSVGTTLEKPCTDPHWGFVIDGELTFVSGSHRATIPAGRAFHVPPDGPAHRFETARNARVAGFTPVEPKLDVSDRGLRAQGFELVAASEPAVIAPAIDALGVATGEIRAESWPMSGYVFSRVRMGERSGYTGGWCDAPHWGLITAGHIAIEWEDAVEVLAPGDVFHCPAGPPGHRLEAADPATFIDLTPAAALDAAGRLADWRHGPRHAVDPSPRGIMVNALG